MKDALIVLFMVLYGLAVLCLTCYMSVTYGWCWIFLLMFMGIRYKSSDDNSNSKEGES